LSRPVAVQCPHDAARSRSPDCQLGANPRCHVRHVPLRWNAEPSHSSQDQKPVPPMTPETPAWLARPDSHTLADALAALASMAETPQLFDAGAEHRPRFGALGLQTEDFAQRHSIASASDLAVFAAATLDQQASTAEP